MAVRPKTPQEQRVREEAGGAQMDWLGLVRTKTKLCAFAALVVGVIVVYNCLEPVPLLASYDHRSENFDEYAQVELELAAATWPTDRAPDAATYKEDYIDEEDADAQEELDKAELLLGLELEKKMRLEPQLREPKKKKKNVVPPPLYATDEEAKLRQKSLDALFSMRNPEFTMFNSTARPPSIVLLKLHKVGGTSVALALKNASVHYNLNECDYLRRCSKDVRNEIYFEHNKHGPWIQDYFPKTDLVTIFREPMSRFVSKTTWAFNRQYFIDYPKRACDYSQGDKRPIKQDHFYCHDDDTRHNATLDHFLSRLSRQPNAPGNCGEACTSISPTKSEDPGVVQRELDEAYSLFATTEHLDEFLVLLALRFEWSIDTMIYEKCKDQGKAKVSLRDLVGPHAWALDKVKMRSSAEGRVYEFAKAKFESFLAKLGPDFQRLVKIFKARLQAFQMQQKVERNGDMRWRHHKSVLFC